jgi:hypothetical protein
VSHTFMKRFRIYRHGTLDADSVVILDFTTVPEEALHAAEQEAFELSFSDPVGDEDSIEDAYEQYPQLCGFEPWIWELSGGWKPQGLNRAWLMMGQKLAAKNELLEFLRTFINTYQRYISHAEMREVLDQALGDAPHTSRD